MKTMQMRFIENIKKSKGYTNYGLAKALRALGVEITTQGIDAYEKPEARSMRIDVLLGLYDLAEISEKEFIKQLRNEFRDRTKK
jgi:hypothetical protein